MSTLPGLKTTLDCEENINFYESIKNHPLCEIDFEQLINKPLERLSDYQEIISKIIIDDDSLNTSDEKDQLRKAKQGISDLINNSKMSRRLTHKLIDEIKSELFNSGIKLDDGNRDFIKAVYILFLFFLSLSLTFLSLFSFLSLFLFIYIYYKLGNFSHIYVFQINRL